MTDLLWVAGGRDYTDVDAIKRALIPYHGWTLITGAARGADLTAETAWRYMQRPYVGVPARWSMYDRSAGPIRNRVIGGEWMPTRMLVFPGGRGTLDAVGVAESFGIEIVKGGDR